MLSRKGFDLWADGYDKTVGLSDDEGTYPFAGYKDVLNAIYSAVLASRQHTVLDIGFGTGVLTAKLYEYGCEIYGQDFSEKMLAIAQQKMPGAKLYCKDFAEGLAEPILQSKYDSIVSTYALHHLTDEQKIAFIGCLLPLLKENGCIYIGDVAFANHKALQACREQAGEEWDDEEFYFVFEELRKAFPQMLFEKLSFCAGVLRLQR